MNKFFYLIVALMSFAYTLEAQESNTDTRSKLVFGLKAGINYSNVWDVEAQDFQADPKLGFAGGAFFCIPIGKLFGLQPELLISQKGLKATGTLLGYPYSFKRTTTYLDIPLQLQVKSSEVLTILIGPQISYLLHERNAYTWGANQSAQEQEFDNDNLRKHILGFVAGIDLHFSKIVVSGKMGMDFQNYNEDGTSYAPRYKNRWVQLTLGYKI